MTVTNNDLERRVAAVEASLALVAQEQQHLREVLNGGIQNISAQIALLSQKMDTFAQQADASRGDASLTPAGRQLLAELEVLRARFQERDLKDAQRDADLEEALDWQLQVKSQLTLLRWLGGGGALALAGMVLKLLGVPVPF